MTILYTFTAWLKKFYVSHFKRMIVTLLVILLFLGALAFLCDRFLAWNYLTNLLRAVLVLGEGVTLFSLLFGFFMGKKIKWLSDFNFQQRRNLALIIITLSFLLTLLLVKPYTLGYTNLVSVLVAFWLYVFYVIKPTYDEVADEANEDLHV